MTDVPKSSTGYDSWIRCCRRKSLTERQLFDKARQLARETNRPFALIYYPGERYWKPCVAEDQFAGGAWQNHIPPTKTKTAAVACIVKELRQIKDELK